MIVPMVRAGLPYGRARTSFLDKRRIGFPKLITFLDQKKSPRFGIKTEIDTGCLFSMRAGPQELLTSASLA